MHCRPFEGRYLVYACHFLQPWLIPEFTIALYSCQVKEPNIFPTGMFNENVIKQSLLVDSGKPWTLDIENSCKETDRGLLQVYNKPSLIPKLSFFRKYC